jgi:hypothetical protein
MALNTGTVTVRYPVTYGDNQEQKWISLVWAQSFNANEDAHFLTPQQAREFASSLLLAAHEIEAAPKHQPVVLKPSSADE